jgi:hypothetical protein
LVVDNFEPEEREESLLEDIAFGDLPAYDHVDTSLSVYLNLALSNVAKVVCLQFQEVLSASTLGD